jgi:hypothetical protein
MSLQKLFTVAAVLALLPATTVADDRLAKVMTVEKADYAIAKSDPSLLVVSAEGTVNSTGWSNGKLVPWVYVQPPADGILDMDFIAVQPDSIVIWVITEISSWEVGPLEPWMKGVRIHASTNDKVVMFGAASSLSVSQGDGNGGDDWLPWPWDYSHTK